MRLFPTFSPFIISLATGISLSPCFCGAASAQSAAPTSAPPLTAQIWDFSTPKTGAKPDPKLAGFVVPYTAPGGMAAQVEVAQKAGALRFTNQVGGSFGLKLNVPTFDATQFPTLEMDYTRSTDAKINFFFKVNGGYYGVIFSGPARVRPGSFLLGTVPDVGTKGRVVLPLRDWLRRFQPRAEHLQVEEILAGNWDNQGYLLAGIGGNGPGAAWSLSKFALLPAKNTAPQLGAASFEGNDIVWPLSGGVLDTASANLSVDDKNFTFDSPLLRLETKLNPDNSTAERVVFDAGDAGIALSDNQKLALKLADKVEDLTWKLGAHAAPAPLPRLKWEGAAPLDMDFETGKDGVDADANNTVLLLDPKTPVSGENSLLLSNPRTASTFDARFQIGKLDAAQFPMLTFAYRNDDRLRLDFRLRWGGADYFVRFTDRDGSQLELGRIADVPDGQWHYATLPLLDWMKRARPAATDFTVQSLGVADDGWKGNPSGVTWSLDDLRAAPALSSNLKATATLRDVSGVRAVSYQIDQKPDTEADTSPEGGASLDISLAGRAAGLYFLHLRAQNGAGTWSKTASYPFVVK